MISYMKMDQNMVFATLSEVLMYEDKPLELVKLSDYCYFSAINREMIFLDGYSMDALLRFENFLRAITSILQKKSKGFMEYKIYNELFRIHAALSIDKKQLLIEHLCAKYLSGKYGNTLTEFIGKLDNEDEYNDVLGEMYYVEVA